MSDVAAVEACVAAAYAPYRSQITDLPDVTSGLSEEIRDYRCWVATVGSKTIGCIILHDDETPPVLANLAVDPSAGGRGVGTALISLVESHCRAHGDEVLSLSTHIDLPRLREYYERLGFKVTQIEAPKVRMEKPLRSTSLP